MRVLAKKHSKRSRGIKILLIISILSYSIFCLAGEKYYLCGPDEDGCPKDAYEYCFCIPYNYNHAESQYCLDFTQLTCVPLERTKYCDPGLTFKSQGHCLATIFQSIPEPPCKIKSQSFCKEHNSYFCNEDGNPIYCHH